MKIPLNCGSKGTTKRTPTVSCRKTHGCKTGASRSNDKHVYVPVCASIYFAVVWNYEDYVIMWYVGLMADVFMWLCGVGCVWGWWFLQVRLVLSWCIRRYLPYAHSTAVTCVTYSFAKPDDEILFVGGCCVPVTFKSPESTLPWETTRPPVTLIPLLSFDAPCTVLVLLNVMNEWNNVDNNIVKKCSSTLFIANMGVAGHYD